MKYSICRVSRLVKETAYWRNNTYWRLIQNYCIILCIIVLKMSSPTLQYISVNRHRKFYCSWNNEPIRQDFFKDDMSCTYLCFFLSIGQEIIPYQNLQTRRNSFSSSPHYSYTHNIGIHGHSYVPPPLPPPPLQASSSDARQII